MLADSKESIADTTICSDWRGVLVDTVNMTFNKKLVADLVATNNCIGLSCAGVFRITRWKAFEANRFSRLNVGGEKPVTIAVIDVRRD